MLLNITIAQISLMLYVVLLMWLTFGPTVSVKIYNENPAQYRRVAGKWKNILIDFFRYHEDFSWTLC